MATEQAQSSGANTRPFLSAGSPSVAIMTLAKGTLGAGILALPQKAMYSGVPIFLILLALGSYFTARSVEMITRGCRQAGQYVFEEVTERLLGRPVALGLGISMLLSCYGSSIAYIIAIRGALALVLDHVDEYIGHQGARFVIYVVGAIVLVGMSVFEQLNSLRLVSLAGVVGVFITVASVLYALYADGISASLKKESFSGTLHAAMSPNGGIVEIIGAISTVTFALCNQFNVPQVYEELHEKRSNTVRFIAYVSTALPTLLYALTALAGFLHSGSVAKDNIFLNFDSLIEEGKFVIYFGIFTVVLSIGICHILNNFPMRLSVAFFLPQKWSKSGWIRDGVPLFTAISSIVIGTFFSNFSMVLGLLGAITGSVICYIVPALLSIKVEATRAASGVHEEDESLKLPSMDTSSNPAKHNVSLFWLLRACPLECLMIIVGVLLAIIGTVSEFYSEFSKKKAEIVRV